MLTTPAASVPATPALSPQDATLGAAPIEVKCSLVAIDLAACSVPLPRSAIGPVRCSSPIVTPPAPCRLTASPVVSLHGAGGVTIGEEHLTGPIADLGNGTLHAARSIATSEHFTSMGAAPKVASCGDSAGVAGTDAAGVVSTGANATSCAVTFAKAFAAAPVCIAQTFANAAPVTFVSGLTPTGFTVGFSAPLHGAFSYICMGRS